MSGWLLDYLSSEQLLLRFLLLWLLVARRLFCCWWGIFNPDRLVGSELKHSCHLAF